MIIANDVSRNDIGFNSDDNAVSVFWPTGEARYEAMSKQQLARHLITLMADRYQEYLLNRTENTHA